MAKNDEHLDRILDRGIEAIQRDRPDPEAVDRASERVWAQLGRETEGAVPEAPAEAIRSCTDYRRLIPDYLGGRLSGPRRLLLEDHSRECVPCRRALQAARTGRREAAEIQHATRGRTAPWVWTAAAAAMIVAALVILQMTTGMFTPETGASLRVVEVDGSLFRVLDQATATVAAGTVLDQGDPVRTAKGSRAVVELADGSRVEIKERSEIRVRQRGDDETIHLTRGGIIVQASDQGSDRLHVRTGDCLVSVTGTVFSVNHGTRGSRVSVLEGAVRVKQGGRLDVLHRGDQVTTSPLLHPIPIAEEIAWSGSLDDHLALLRELTELRKELRDELPRPGLRHSTRLLDLAPRDTVVFIALPNLTDTLTEAERLVREKAQSSPALGKWWQENVVESGAEPALGRAIEKIRLFGEQLGEEVVVILRKDGEEEPKGPILLAELRRPEGFRQLLASEIDKIVTEGEDRPLRLVEDPFSVSDRPGMHAELLFWIADDLLAAAASAEDLKAVAGVLVAPLANPFVDSPFHDRLVEAYRSGVGMLFAANVEAILPQGTSDDRVLEQLGLADMQYFIAGRHELDDRTVTSAALTFAQQRRGLAAWLAEPAPMGALDFVSPDASLAGGFVVRNPATMLEELFGSLGELDADFGDELERFEKEQAVDLVQDVAGPLGGEVAFAVDGPILPKPAWKLVVEVYDPARLQQTIEWAVERFNAVAESEGHAASVRVGAEPDNVLRGLSLHREDGPDRTYYALSADGLKIAVHYTFVDGFLVAAPQRTLLDRAIQQRTSGITLPASARFRALLPQDGRINFSAVLYQNLGPILDPLLQSSMARSGGLTPDQRAVVEALAAETEPGLYFAYGEPNRIVLGGTDRAGLLGTEMGSVFSVGSLMSVQGALREAARAQSGDYHGGGAVKVD